MGNIEVNRRFMYLPTTIEEIKDLGWDHIDIILISGDSYIDSPFIGVSVIGKLLLNAGYNVAIIAQPDLKSNKDIMRLGEPKLFWGITGGCIDSMVANRTASGKRRRSDDYTPGGENNRRPDRALLAYSNLIRQYFKNTAPIVLGGLEASLRRVAHYDYWSNKIRRSILFDAKATYLLYGMAERSVIDLAEALKENKKIESIRGLCYISKEIPENSIELPPYQECSTDKKQFTEMFNLFYNNNDPVTAQTLVQQHDSRYLVQNPPAKYLTTKELDKVHELEFHRDLHPYYLKDGKVKALETIRFSITTHRGCYGECNFCAIAVHQGRSIRWRSKESIINEAKILTQHPLFKGIIFDVGGPTANMYGIECSIKEKSGACKDKRCLFPTVCPSLKMQHNKQEHLLKRLRKLPKIKHIFVASGIRYDMILDDKKYGISYLKELLAHHISGQMKIAPEHSEDSVLNRMGKPGVESLLEFKEQFYKITKDIGKKQFLTYYMIAAHPGCTNSDMKQLKNFAKTKLNNIPEQVQIFTPTPSTYSSLMYWTEWDPFTNKPCFVEKGAQGREKQKSTLLSAKKPYHKKRKKTF